jgi:non-ribosomal peptide synthetase component F
VSLQVPHHQCASLREALELALCATTIEQEKVRGEGERGRDTPVLLAGSLFLVGEALALESGGTFVPRSQ